MLERRLRRAGLLLLMLLGGLVGGPALAATGTCGPATIQGTAPADYAAYCWFDMTGYVEATARSTGGQNFVITLPGGATISFNLKATTPSGSTAGPVVPSAVPSWSGAAFGNTGFNGIPGKPVLYQQNDGTAVLLSFTSITLAAGTSTNLPFAFIAADGESSNQNESLVLTTTGNPWTLAATIANGGTNPTLTGVGTTTATVTGVAGTVGSYAFSSMGTPNTVTARIVGGGKQGALFGVRFPAADLSIDKSHSGNFVAGSIGSYNIVVHNNGVDTVSGAMPVTDTLPTGLSYSSFSGTGWSCSAVGQVVTCNNTATSLANGASLPALTLNVTVAANAPASVTNTVSVTNPIIDPVIGNNTDTDATTIIGGPQPPASGNKILYVYDDLQLTRTPQANNSTTPATVPDGGSTDWVMTPVIPTGETLTLSAGVVTAQLVIDATGFFQGSGRNVTVQLRSNTGPIASTVINLSNGPTSYTFNLNVPQTTLNAGNRLVLRVTNAGFFGSSPLAVYQKHAVQGRSTLTFATTTVINVDSVAVYSAAYPAVTTQTSYVAGNTVFVRAVISDPFGAYDVSAANITLTDPNGVVQVTTIAMTEIPAAATAASKTYQYSYTLPAGAKAGNWLASVTGKEGTENTVTHTGNAVFKVNGPPLTIVKFATVYSDPVNATTNPKAIPGALVTYQIIVTSPTGTQVDTNSVVVTDPIPVNTVLFVNDLPDQSGTAPVLFIPGTSNLTFTYVNLANLSDDVAFSNNGGTTWTYVPTPDANGVDAAVNAIRLNPKDAFAPGTSVTVGFRVQIK